MLFQLRAMSAGMEALEPRLAMLIYLGMLICALLLLLLGAVGGLWTKMAEIARHLDGER